MFLFANIDLHKVTDTAKKYSSRSDVLEKVVQCGGVKTIAQIQNARLMRLYIDYDSLILHLL
jgi:hypothetical protein